MYMIYHRRTRPTGRVIARGMGFRHYGIREPRNNPEVVLRWGNSLPIDTDMEINPAEAIRMAADKWVTLRTLNQEGIPVPFTSRNFNEVRERANIVLGRKKFGSQGRNIEIIQDGMRPTGESTFYTQFIQSTREFRVHVVDGAVIRVQGKYLDHPGHPDAGVIKNHKTGYRFRQPRSKLRQTRLDDSIRAVKALGLDFGAVDMIPNGDGEHYILEVNTGPSCSPLTATQYVNSLCNLITKRTDGGVEMVPHLDRMDGLGNEPEDQVFVDVPGQRIMELLRGR